MPLHVRFSPLSARRSSPTGWHVSYSTQKHVHSDAGGSGGAEGHSVSFADAHVHEVGMHGHCVLVEQPTQKALQVVCTVSAPASTHSEC